MAVSLCISNVQKQNGQNELLVCLIDSHTPTYHISSVVFFCIFLVFLLFCHAITLAPPPSPPLPPSLPSLIDSPRQLSATRHSFPSSFFYLCALGGVWRGARPFVVRLLLLLLLLLLPSFLLCFACRFFLCFVFLSVRCGVVVAVVAVAVVIPPAPFIRSRPFGVLCIASASRQRPRLCPKASTLSRPRFVDLSRVRGRRPSSSSPVTSFFRKTPEINVRDFFLLIFKKNLVLCFGFFPTFFFR